MYVHMILKGGVCSGTQITGRKMTASLAGGGEDPARVRPIKTEYFWIQEAVART